MKAIVMNGIGGTDVMDHVDRPEPVAAHGHVVVEIAAAGGNCLQLTDLQRMP
jgi:NADPH2:quinone reductase